MEIPVFSVYDHKGNLLKEVRREVELSMEVKKAIAGYIYTLIRESEKQDGNS